MDSGHPGTYPVPSRIHQQHLNRPPAHHAFHHSPQSDPTVHVRFVQQGHQMQQPHQHQPFYHQHQQQQPGYHQQQYSGSPITYPQQVPSGYPAHELPGNQQARFMYSRNSQHDDYRQHQQHVYGSQQQQSSIIPSDPTVGNSQQQMAYRPRFYSPQTHPGVQQQQQQQQQQQRFSGRHPNVQEYGTHPGYSGQQQPQQPQQQPLQQHQHQQHGVGYYQTPTNRILMHRDMGNMPSPQYQQHTMPTSQLHSTFPHQHRFSMRQQYQQQHFHSQMVGPSQCQMQQYTGVTPVNGYNQAMMARPPINNTNMSATSMQQYPPGPNATVVNSQQAAMQQQAAQLQQQQQIPQQLATRHQQPGSSSSIAGGDGYGKTFDQPLQQQLENYQEQQHRQALDLNSQHEFHQQATQQDTTVEGDVAQARAPEYSTNSRIHTSEHVCDSAPSSNRTKSLENERQQSPPPSEILRGQNGTRVANSPSVEPKDNPVELKDTVVEVKQNLPSKDNEKDEGYDFANQLSLEDVEEEELTLKNTETVGDEEEEIVPEESAASEIPTGADAQNALPEKVLVPTGWRRLALSDTVIYYSPSGVQIKSMEEAKSYLLTDGTCKCGLECPMDINESFDFDIKKQSQVLPFPTVSTTVASRYCANKKLLEVLAAADRTPAFINKISHVHKPVVQTKKGFKRRTRKKIRPFSGMKVSQMLEAREAERQRINEIISQHKMEHEARIMGGTAGLSQEPCTSTISSDNLNKEMRAAAEDKTVVKESQSDMTKDTSEQVFITQQKTPDVPSSEVALKNIEIRRMSSTEEGDRILNDAWTSPDKDEHVKTPLEMVENIVSNIASSSPSTPSATVASSGASSPSVSGEPVTAVKTKNTKSVRTQLLANIAQLQQQKQASEGLSATGPSQSQQQGLSCQPAFPVQVQNVNGQQQTHQHPQQQIQLNPQPPQASHVVTPAQQPVMQLVNTINGPMLMQAIPISGATGGLVQLPALTSMPTAAGVVTTQATHTALPAARPIQPAPPTMQRRDVPDLRKKGKKKKTIAGSNTLSTSTTRATPVPILMSPAVSAVSGPSLQPAPPGGGQLVAIGRHTAAGMTPHQGIIQPANIVINPAAPQSGSSVMAAVAAAPSNQVFLSNNAILPVQGVVFGQIPDGSIYPMQSAATSGAISPSTVAPIQLVPGGPAGQQPIIGGGPFSNSGPILVNGPNGPQQLIPASNAPPGTFILAQTAASQPHPGYIPAQATATVPVSQQQLQQQRQPQQQLSSKNAHCAMLGNPQQIDDRRRSSTASSSSASTSSSSDASSQLDDNRLAHPVEFAKNDDVDEKEEEEDVEEEMDCNEESESDSDDREANDDALVANAKTDERDSEEDEGEEGNEEKEPAVIGDIRDAAEEQKSSYERKDELDQGSSSGQLQLRRAAATPPRRSPRKSVPDSPSKSSPRTTTFIQSNKVDSSGLRATPPHTAADLDAFVTFNDSGVTPNEDEDEDEDEEPEGSGLDTSGGTEASGEVGSSGDGDSSRKRRRRRKRNAEQILRDDLGGMLGDSDASPTPSTSTAEDGSNPSASSSSLSSAVPRSFSAGDVVWGPCANFPSWPGKLLEDARVTKDLVAEPTSARVCWFGSKEESVVPVASLKDLSDGLEAHHKERKRLRKGRRMNASLEKAIQEAMLELDKISGE